MIISSTYNFIFFKSFKTASSSLLYSLGLSLSPIDPSKDYVCNAGHLEGLERIPNTFEGIRKPIPRVPNLVEGSAHKYPSEVLEDEFKGDYESFENFDRFVVVRNPWDLVVSSFCWAIATGESDSANLIDFVHRREDNGFDWGRNKFFWDEKYISHWIRYENLQQDYFNFCQERNLIAYQLPNLKAATRPLETRSYQPFFDRESADIVGTHYKDIINKFNYQF